MLPRALLVDTVVVYEPTLHNGRASVSANGRTITGVCFQSNNALVNSSIRLTDGYRGVLFIDANSSGAFEITPGSKVVINGLEPMEAAVVSPYRGLGGRLHHWEILVK